MVYYWNAPKSKDTASHKLDAKGQEKVRKIANTSGAELKKNSPSTRRRG